LNNTGLIELIMILIRLELALLRHLSLQALESHL